MKIISLVNKFIPLLDQASFNFPAERQSDFSNVTTGGAEGAVLMQSSNIGNNQVSNTQQGNVVNGGSFAFDFSSMGVDLKTFTVTSTGTNGAVITYPPFTGSSAVGNGPTLSLQSGTVTVGVTQPGTNTNTNYNYSIRAIDPTKSAIKNLPIN